MNTRKGECNNCFTKGYCGLKCGENLRKRSIFSESLYINME